MGARTGGVKGHGMDRAGKTTSTQEVVWLGSASCSLDGFRRAVERTATMEQYPLARAIERNVVLYDAASVRAAADDEARVSALMAEWHRIFLDGPGIVVFKGAYSDLGLIDAVSAVLQALIAEERAATGVKGDHFARHGTNARVWNTHEKLCMREPELYARYSANECIALASRAWLGPLYQITAQVNLVYPGGQAQTPHRDYHMGFQTSEQLRSYPANVHRLSAALTLQGGVAHCDMAVETGPTKFLPYSQTYLPGYFATLRPEFRDYFEQHYSQLPLAKGDALFFNPAVFHAAGDNVTQSTERLANLMQIGSGYGRSIEIVDRARMTKHAYPALLAMQTAKVFSPREMENLIAATAEGYPFPCNLDIDSPLSGMAPASQQDILRRALNEGWSAEKLRAEIDAHVARRVSH